MAKKNLKHKSKVSKKSKEINVILIENSSIIEET